MSNVVGGNVAPDMMDRDQGNPQGHGRRLGKVYPNQYCSNEAGGIAHRHSINIPLGQSGIRWRKGPDHREKGEFPMNILAFESTCDETAVAVVRDGRESSRVAPMTSMSV